ncbi:MAG TPA: PVC-type heme-binding CxxCH protein [Urbifossiella sp.]|nr:PVC-type heme-binding CxxCH protein [Urbifossiella sp.]
MPLPKLARAAVLFTAVVALAAYVTPDADAQKKAQPKATDRPKRPDLPASSLPLALVEGERIALVGNSTAERMNLFGHFEAMLHKRFADKKLVVRNFGRPADEVAIQQRSGDYTKIDDPLYAFGPDTFLCFFGFNESFAGKDGVAKFEKDYEAFLDNYANKYPRDGTGSKPRFVLVSPIAFEAPDPTLGITPTLPVDQRFLPSGKAENENLKLYAAAVKAVADRRKLAFVDVFDATAGTFQAQAGLQFTINGCHLNEQGDALLARLMIEGLFGGPVPEVSAQLRAAVVDKSFVHQQDYRMLNGWYVYGGRRTYDTETFPKEYAKLRAMAAVRDQYVWDIAAGKQVSAGVDDSKTGELYTPPTRFGQPGQKYSENPGELKYQTPEEFVRTASVAAGMRIIPFADETKFPEIAKPVQLGFDNKGRLWVACMPNYPLWKPGDPKPNDKLVILEDTDKDGKADKSTVFYDQLHCPTGFEFWNGGVLVMDQPRILWLKDTDGDGKADLVVHLFDGWASDDTHHRGGWEWGPGGYLHLLEGIAMSTTLETPFGPHRSQGAGGTYVIDPRNQKVRQFSLPGMYNMWCYVFDEWGQGIVGDGTTANQTWDTPLSGAQFSGRKGINFILPNGERPNLGSEWLVSRALPDEVQKQFTYACVINLNGLPRYTMKDDGAGFMGTRVKGADGKHSDLIKSPDKHFRPADPHIGPDGALWFGDWANALIGHMQYSQRDPNRDHTRGRVYRLIGEGKQPLTPVTQYGKGVAELLNQFTEYEWRTRYNARRELRDRPTAEVLAGTSQWVAKLDPSGKDFERLRTEALWVQQGHHVVQPELLKAVLASKAHEARAAAVRVAADDRAYIPDALPILKAAATDPHPRVRTEALRGLSFFNTPDSIDAMLASARMPLDYWTKYTLEASLGATEAAWRPTYLAGKVKDNPEADRLMAGILASSKAGGAAAPHLKLLLSAEPQPAEVKNRAMTALAGLKGNATNGRAVFTRGCIACHKVGNGDGQDYGPNLAGVAAKMPRTKIIESIIDPNAEVDAKYTSTRVVTLDGKSVSGLLVSENKTELAIFDGMMRRTIRIDDIDTRVALKQSSMPEGQAATMAPSEFVDLIEYLDSLKTK